MKRLTLNRCYTIDVSRGRNYTELTWQLIGTDGSVKRITSGAELRHLVKEAAEGWNNLSTRETMSVLRSTKSFWWDETKHGR